MDKDYLANSPLVPLPDDIVARSKTGFGTPVERLASGRWPVESLARCAGAEKSQGVRGQGGGPRLAQTDQFLNIPRLKPGLYGVLRRLEHT
jgi:hypothetical protein